jgi:hypothetical protein
VQLLGRRKEEGRSLAITVMTTTVARSSRWLGMAAASGLVRTTVRNSKSAMAQSLLFNLFFFGRGNLILIGNLRRNNMSSCLDHLVMLALESHQGAQSNFPFSL